MPLAQTVPDEVTALEHWSEALGDLYARIAHRFRQVEVRERVRRYLAGLLARVERKCQATIRRDSRITLREILL